MSAVPSDDKNRTQSEMAQPGWHVCTGLTLSAAEDLLDQLEACGVQQREVNIGPEGVTVRWRAVWPRLVTEG